MDYLFFILAEKLGKTKQEIMEEMSPKEFFEWMVYLELKHDLEKEAIEEAKRKNK